MKVFETTVQLSVLLSLILSQTTASTCGNSLRETGESCDDGNTNSGDGCSANCFVEYLWTCTCGSTTSKDTCYKYQITTSSSSTCTTIAAYFNNTCPYSSGVTTAGSSVSALASSTVSCSSYGKACSGTSTTCSLSRKLCVSCTTTNGVSYIRVQTNAIPDHCFYTSTNAIDQTQTLDFSVALQTSISAVTSLSIATQTDLDSYQCSSSSSWVATPPSRVSYTANSGSTQLQKIVGIAFNGVPIMIGSTEYPYDPYFPSIVGTSPVSYAEDTCLGNNDYTTFYHYYSYSPCIVDTAMKYNLTVKTCSSNSTCDTHPLYYATNYTATANRTVQAIGLSKDGYLIYGPFKSDGTFWQPCEVDVCNGRVINDNYAYVSSVFYPYTVGCWGPGNTPGLEVSCSKNAKYCTESSLSTTNYTLHLILIGLLAIISQLI